MFGGISLSEISPCNSNVIFGRVFYMVSIPRFAGYRIRMIVTVGIVVFVLKLFEISMVVSSTAFLNEENVCSTAECRKTAEKLSSYMDRSVGPCDNFYKFACGNFVKNFELPKNTTKYHPNSLVTKHIREYYESTLTQKLTVRDSVTLRLLKIYHQTCRRKGKFRMHQSVQMMNELGGWPLLQGETWKESKFNLVEALHGIRRKGFRGNFFFNLNVAKDPTDAKRLILQVKPSFDSMENHKSFTSDQITKSSRLKILGKNYERAEELRMSRFEQKIFDVLQQLQPEVPETVTLQELRDGYAPFPWDDFLIKMLFNQVKLENIDKIQILYPTAVKKLIRLLDGAEKRTLANWIFMNFYYDVFKHSSCDKHTSVCTYDCWGKLNDKLAPALNLIYTDENFNVTRVKGQMADFIQNMKFSYQHLIKEAQWLDEETRSRALEKLSKIEIGASILSNFTSMGKLDNYYFDAYEWSRKHRKSLRNLDKILLENVFEYVYSAGKHEAPEYYLNSPVDKINAAYVQSLNNIKIFTGKLEEANLNADEIPNYIKYGPLGYAIGHELTHAFDTYQNLFHHPRGGEERTTTALQEKRAKEYFTDGLNCIVDQYDNFKNEETGLKMDGAKTFRENLADISGVKAAYLAYEEFERKHGEEEVKLPGFENYSSRQMFWLSFAHSRCSKYDLAKLDAIMSESGRTLDEFRVIGTLQNRREFSKDFDCPANSFMNPKDKCNIW